MDIYDFYRGIKRPAGSSNSCFQTETAAFDVEHREVKVRRRAGTEEAALLQYQFSHTRQFGTEILGNRVSMTPKSQRKTWFNKYRDPELTGDQEAITPEGYQQLCEALGYNIEGIEALVTLWKLGAKDLGTVQYADWEQGLSDMGVTSAAGLKKSVNHIVASFPSDAKSYRAFYRKVFDFLKGERQRTADVEYVKAVLPVVASGNWLIERFVEFLDDNGEKIKSISRDQWQLLPDLSVSIRSASDLDSYSTDDAWPRLYDDFVKWMKSRS